MTCRYDTGKEATFQEMNNTIFTAEHCKANRFITRFAELQVKRSPCGYNLKVTVIIILLLHKERKCKNFVNWFRA